MFHDEIREYVVPAGILDDRGWQDVQTFIVGKFAVRVPREEIGDAWTTKAGKLPKRIAKYLRKQGIKPEPETISEIGNLASRHVSRESVYCLDFTQEFDWRAGDFGDAGSCFWGTNAAARDMLADNGAYAVRFYDGSRGIGRAWIAPYDDAWIIFNAYGPFTLLTIGRILAHAFGCQYRYVKLENNGSTTGTLYINGGNGIAIGTVDVPERVDLEWEDQGERCESCGCDCSQEYDLSPNGERLCYECFAEHFSSCFYCGEPHAHEDVHECDGDWYCESCAERRGFSRCGTCEEWHECSATTVDDEPICDSCCEDQYCCDECAGFTPEIVEFQESFYCSGCIAEIAEPCACCGELAAEPLHLDGRAYCCDDCRDGLPHYREPAPGQLVLALC